ncbi:hypothetical protein VPHD480_0202 [Vibrio phage D480]
MNNHAYRIKTEIPMLAIEEGDVFVQSPFNGNRYQLVRQPNRPTTDISLIQQFSHLYDEIYVPDTDIPEVIANWKEHAQAEHDVNLKLVDKLYEQIDFIQSQITVAQDKAHKMADYL